MSKIKLVIFDLDGVLVKAKNIHYEALNEALGSSYAISWNEHLSTYDGLKTTQKLEMLSEKKGLSKENHKTIWEIKQKLTLKKLKALEPNKDLILCMKNLVSEGYKIAVCSNSIRKTCLTVLSKLGIMEFMDLIISNEDVKNSKPHAEMYWKAISIMSCLPEETLIVEDSPYGLLAAARSKSHILRVKNTKETTYKNINNRLVSEKLLYCVHAKYLNVLEMLKEDYEYIIISDADMIVRKSLKDLINEIDKFDILFKHGSTSSFYANKFKLPSKIIYEEGFFIVKNNLLVKDFFTKLVNIIEKSKKEGTYHLDIDTFEVVNLVHNSNNIKVGELKYIFKDFNLKEESIVWSGQSGNKNSEKFKNEQSKYIS